MNSLAFPQLSSHTQTLTQPQFRGLPSSDSSQPNAAKLKLPGLEAEHCPELCVQKHFILIPLSVIKFAVPIWDTILPEFATESLCLIALID